MCNIVSFDTNSAFRYAIKNAPTSDDMARLHEQYALWREGEPSKYLKPASKVATQRFVSYGKDNESLPVVLRDHDGVHLGQLNFGFIPNWRSDRPKDDPLKAVDRAKKALNIGRKTWNAASESMFEEEKRTWKDSAHDRRCIILLDGVYVFHEHEGKKYPFYICRADGDCMPLAGLWDTATIDGKEYVTCAILMQEANDAMQQINNWGEHPYGPHRMPIVLDPEHFNQWLEPIEEGDYDKTDALYSILNQPEEGLLEYKSVAMEEDGMLTDSPESQEEHVYKELDIKL
ncbi:MAG: hypothetical protein Salg2KO_03150 [Salibacteraceae bacterium]